MLKKLSKFGNSMALIIDKPILQLLGIDEDTMLKIQTDGKTITIVPVEGKGEGNEKKKRKRNERAREIIDDLVEEYSSALEELARK